MAFRLWLFEAERGSPAQTVAGRDTQGQAVLLAINDVYRLKGVDGGKRGGLARVRALRRQLENEHGDVLLLHAGDFLAPSLLSRSYYGAQMVDVMNKLDGKLEPGSFDPRLFVTFGNHEFDDSDCDNAENIRMRVAQSEFTWLASNLDFAGCDDMAGLPVNAKVVRRDMVELGGIRVGLYGLTLPLGKDQPNAGSLQEIIHASDQVVSGLRRSGADVVVAVTHLYWKDDLKLLMGAQAPPDLIIGGHDHSRMAISKSGVRWTGGSTRPPADARILKADADAVSAWVVKVGIQDEDGGKELHFTFDLVELDGGRREDRVVAGLSDNWLRQHAEAFCSAEKDTDADCLEAVVGRTQAVVEAEETKNREQETGFGNWVADQLLARMKDKNSDVTAALMPSGNLRLNYDLAANSDITRRHIEELIQYDGRQYTSTISSQLLWKAVANSLSQPTDGGWGHWSGIAAETERDAERGYTLKTLKVKLGDKSIDVNREDTAQKFTVASSPYHLCGGDGYEFVIQDDEGNAAKPFPSRSKCMAQIGEWANSLNYPKIKEIIQTAIEVANPDGIAPEIDNRLCLPDKMADRECLIDVWSRAGNGTP